MTNPAATRRFAFAAAAAIFLAPTRPAWASLISSFDLEQYVEAVYSGSPTTDVIKPASAQGVPLHQVVSQDTGRGGTVTATYDVYDNGTTAGFNFQTSAATIAANNGLEERSNGDHPTRFILGQAVSYTLSVYGSTGNVTVDLSELLPDQGYGGLSTYPGTEYDYAGTLPAGVQCVLRDSWALSNIGPGLPASLSGSDAIVLTFTAVPEPSSVTLAAIGVVAGAGVGCDHQRRRNLKR